MNLLKCTKSCGTFVSKFVQNTFIGCSLSIRIRLLDSSLSTFRADLQDALSGLLDFCNKRGEN